MTTKPPDVRQVLQPAMDEGDDYDQHFVLTHFLLDGHHKVEAAVGPPLANASRPKWKS